MFVFKQVSFKTLPPSLIGQTKQPQIYVIGWAVAVSSLSEFLNKDVLKSPQCLGF